MPADAPPLPAGWEGSESRLLWLDDPSGRAAAWLAPEFGANCIGFAVRRQDEWSGDWTHLFHSEGPAALAERPSRFGCPILFPFPGSMLDARYTWRGVERRLPPNVPLNPNFMHGFAHTRPWRVERVGTNSLRGELFTGTDLTPAEREGYPFDIRLLLQVQLQDRELSVRLEAVNEGVDAAPVGIGLHPYFDPVGLGGQRQHVEVDLPGFREHVFDSIPVGNPRAARRQPRLPPLGESLHVSRTELTDSERHPSATLSYRVDDGRDRLRTVRLKARLSLAGAFRELLLFAPAEQPSISIEPMTVPPGSASQPDGDPNGPFPLEPGATIQASAEFGLEIDDRVG